MKRVREREAHVAALVSEPRFLDGSHCIELGHDAYQTSSDAYDIRQIACCVLRQTPGDGPFLVERHRVFRSKLADPWPRWRAFFGSGVGLHGFFGSATLHLTMLLAPASLVALAATDRVPPEEPAWEWDGHRRKPDRFWRERAAFEAKIGR